MQTLVIVGLAFALGGILKGATGVGAPLVAVPLMTSFYDVRFAVAVFVLPNLITNLLQMFIYLHALKHRLFLFALCCAAGIGALVGSLTLATDFQWYFRKTDGHSCFVLCRVQNFYTRLEIIYENSSKTKFSYRISSRFFTKVLLYFITSNFYLFKCNKI